VTLKCVKTRVIVVLGKETKLARILNVKAFAHPGVKAASSFAHTVPSVLAERPWERNV